ncbi:hypothetical protein AKO1_006851 [Acrasis kona]|uniref:Uncharacterized protein n=1 Tax=Acrasis kona TaxID=1008807 RepID=A0AAW2YU60_9EUKA
MSLFGLGASKSKKLIIYIICLLFPFFVVIYATVCGCQQSNKGIIACIINIFLSLIICCFLLCLLWIPGVVYAWYALEGNYKYVLIV